MMNKIKLAMVLSILGLGITRGSTFADVIKEAIPEEYLYCTVCHGTAFMGNPGTQAPRIRGLPAWYVKSQLTAFQKGVRGSHKSDVSGHEMRAAAEGLTADAIVKLANLVSQMPAPSGVVSSGYTKLAEKMPDTEAQSVVPAQPTLIADSERGQILYQQCSGCHGVRAQGKAELMAPPLVGLNDWYITKQVQNFRQGLRGGGDSDSAAQQMRVAAKNLKSDQEIIDIIAYIQQL